MEKLDALTALDALAQETRLDIFRYLVQLGPEGAPAGHIAQALGLPPATLSFHLKTLQHAGLVERQRQSRSLIYAAHFARMNSLLAYLTENCCAGDPGHCATLCEHERMHNTAASAVATSNDLETGNKTMTNNVYNVLFLCTGNSARSILAEALLNHLGRDKFRAFSAGSHPTGKVNLHTLALLAREGISTEGCHSKSWENLPVMPDIVITVCSSAAGETCPAYLGPVLRTHWEVEDSAHITGTDEEMDAAFMTAYRILHARIEAFLALPIEELKHDRVRLKAELDRIGTLLP